MTDICRPTPKQRRTCIRRASRFLGRLRSGGSFSDGERDRQFAAIEALDSAMTSMLIAFYAYNLRGIDASLAAVMAIARLGAREAEVAVTDLTLLGLIESSVDPRRELNRERWRLTSSGRDAAVLILQR